MGNLRGYEDIQAAVKGMLEPTLVEEVLGRVEVRDTFKLPNNMVVRYLCP